MIFNREDREAREEEQLRIVCPIKKPPLFEVVFLWESSRMRMGLFSFDGFLRFGDN